jgi:hypothetical protein
MLASDQTDKPMPARGHLRTQLQVQLGAITCDRDRLAAAVAPRRDHPMMEIAFSLLTRSWARADWPARKELLRAATWLINMYGSAPRLSKADDKPPLRLTRHSKIMSRSKRRLRKSVAAE